MRIIVVGAGILGLSVAARLAERGATVEVLEAGRPGGGLTNTTFAWLNAGFLRVDRATWTLRASSIERWRASFPDVTWLHPGGSLHLTSAGTEGPGETEWWDDLRAWGEPIQTIDPTELATLEPDLRRPATAWTRFERDAWVETDGAVAALLDRLQRAGGTVRAGITVRSVTMSSDAQVRLADGAAHTADAIVVAAARATPDLVGAAAVPLRPASHPSVPGLLVLTRPSRVRLAHVVRVDDLVLRPAPGGRLLIQSGTIDRSLHLDQPTATTHDQVRELLGRASGLMARDRLDGGLEAESVTLAARALPKDGLPIVGWTGDPGGSAYAVVAHSGIVLAPALAEIVADEVLDGRRDPTLARLLPRSSAIDREASA